MTLTSKAELTVRTEFAEVIAGSLSPELGEKIPRTTISVKRNGDELLVRIEAEDQNALRAALNSYIRWMNVAEETAKEAVKR
jgi:tRNA threonylcarbamoyladenosine modification (KEOPS) complex  Pcc1 subunit